jgi:hypothetical protein
VKGKGYIKKRFNKGSQFLFQFHIPYPSVNLQAAISSETGGNRPHEKNKQTETEKKKSKTFLLISSGEEEMMV